MATTVADRTGAGPVAGALRVGSWLMGAAAAGFIGYAVIFFIRNFTDSFLELGIGPNEVNVGKDEIQAFSPALYRLHRPPAHRGVGVHRRHRRRGALPRRLRGSSRVSVGLGRRGHARRSLGSRWRCRRTTRTTSTRSAISALIYLATLVFVVGRPRSRCGRSFDQRRVVGCGGSGG